MRIWLAHGRIECSDSRKRAEEDRHRCWSYEIGADPTRREMAIREILKYVSGANYAKRRDMSRRNKAGQAITRRRPIGTDYSGIYTLRTLEKHLGNRIRPKKF